MKTLQSLTQTSNLFVNSLIGFVLSFMVVSLIAIIVKVVSCPGSISFGLI